MTPSICSSVSMVTAILQQIWEKKVKSPSPQGLAQKPCVCTISDSIPLRGTHLVPELKFYEFRKLCHHAAQSKGNLGAPLLCKGPSPDTISNIWRPKDVICRNKSWLQLSPTSGLLPQPVSLGQGKPTISRICSRV